MLSISLSVKCRVLCDQSNSCSDSDSMSTRMYLLLDSSQIESPASAEEMDAKPLLCLIYKIPKPYARSVNNARLRRLSQK